MNVIFFSIFSERDREWEFHCQKKLFLILGGGCSSGFINASIYVTWNYVYF